MEKAVNTDLLSIVLVLRPEIPANLDRPLAGWWGKASHALLLDAIRQFDPELSEAIHNHQGLQPFTTSSLIGRFPNKKLDPAQTYRLRLTALLPDIARVLAHELELGGILACGRTIELDGLTFRILETGLESSDSKYPWAGSGSYQKLSEIRLIAQTPADLPQHVSLEFASPTIFRSGRRHIPLPAPELVFGSLLEKWNEFSPIALPAEVREYVAECLAVSYFEIKSRAVSVSGGLFIGMVGKVRYIFLEYDPCLTGLVHILADYALFAGIGAKTTMGLGQSRRLDR